MAFFPRLLSALLRLFDGTSRADLDPPLKSKRGIFTHLFKEAAEPQCVPSSAACSGRSQHAYWARVYLSFSVHVAQFVHIFLQYLYLSSI